MTTSLSGGGSEERIAPPNTDDSISASRAPSEEDIVKYGYGVGITSPARGADGHSPPRQPKYALVGGGIGYLREVEVRIERREVLEGVLFAQNKLRDVVAEEGLRYGARPGRRPGQPPDWNDGLRQKQDV